MLNGVVYDILSVWTKLSIQTLVTKFHKELSKDPPVFVFPEIENEEAYLLIDALWFGKRGCVMLYRHSKRKFIIHLSFLKREYGSQIAKDLKLLKEKYHFTAVVSDGGRGIITAVLKTFGHIPHQICLAHLHRGIVSAIGKYPRDHRVKELKKIADHIWLIESKEALRWWKEWLKAWIFRNQGFLRETKHLDTGGWWFVHSGVRKAVRVMLSLPETSFKFLDHPLMPKTTNEIEASIGNLSQKHIIHKGLKRERVESFIKWFVYFYNKKLLSQRKR